MTSVPEAMNPVDTPEHRPGRIEMMLPIILPAAFFVFALLQVWHHIMWRDEIRTWQVCAPCTGLISLWNAMRYEGVPILWYWIVFALTRITSNPFSMQVTHVLIATATIFVVARWAPFSPIVKILFSFGYFPFFEYAAITRNYALVFLFLMIGCVLISRPRVNLLALMGAMLLLTQVSIWGAGLGMLMTLAGIAKAYWTPADERPALWKPVVAAAAVLLGCILSYVEVLPGPGASFTATWGNAPAGDRFLGMFEAVYRGWVPIPGLSRNFWNSNILGNTPVLQSILGAILLVSAIVLLAHRPIAAGVLLLGSLALMGFEFKFRGFARHHGHLFMLLIIGAWLSRTTPELAFSDVRLVRLRRVLDRLAAPALGALLSIHAVAGIGSAIAGAAIPFSSNRSIAQYINKNLEPGVNVLAVPDYFGSPVAQRLGREIYFPQVRGSGFYNTQNESARHPIGGQSILQDAVRLIQASGKSAVILLAWGFPPLIPQDMDVEAGRDGSGAKVIVSLRVLGSIRGGVVEDEDANLYHVSIRTER